MLSTRSSATKLCNTLTNLIDTCGCLTLRFFDSSPSGQRAIGDEVFFHFIWASLGSLSTMSVAVSN
jgi:hypothetical protein